MSIIHWAHHFHYPHIPRHLEEAITICSETAGSQNTDLGKMEIRPETRQRYADFIRALGRFREASPSAFVSLHRDFGDTYFFCYTFGHNDLASVLSKRSQ